MIFLGNRQAHIRARRLREVDERNQDETMSVPTRAWTAYTSRLIDGLVQCLLDNLAQRLPPKNWLT